MKKILVSLLLALTTTAMLTACGSGAPVADEPYEAVDYQLYPAPEGGYVGDTMPFVTDGELELYYLYDTDHNGQGYHPVYRYSTEDLTSYEDDGMMLNFGTMADPDPAIGTGCVMQDQDGLFHMFYTGHNDVNAVTGLGKECVMHATSTDRENWTKIPEDTFYSGDQYENDDFRDPNVFWNEEEQCYWLLIAAREKTQGGVVAKYTSTDLKNWTLCDPIFAPHAQYMLECPDLFKMGDKYYLTYSWDCVTYYAVSDSMNGPFEIPENNVFDGSGFTYYAAKTGELNGNRYLCGWLGRSSLNNDAGLYDWAGNMLNHQLVLKEDGSLGVREPETFSGYFTEDKPFKAVKKEGRAKVKADNVTLSAKDGSTALADLGMRAPTMMLECDLTLSTDGSAGFAFGGSEKDPSYTCFVLDAKNGCIHYEGINLEQLDNGQIVTFTPFDFSQSEQHHVKLVCENEIVVVYVDDTKALSARVFHSTNGAHIGVFANGTDAQFSGITVKVPAK